MADKNFFQLRFIDKSGQENIRIATPVYHNQVLHGILIINVDMNPILNSIKQSNEFDIFIVDKDGYFLIHPNEKYSWSRYLKTKHNLKNEFPKDYNNVLENSNYKSLLLNSFSLENTIPNNENLFLLFSTNDAFINNIEENNYKLTFYLAVIILVISIPIGLIISIKPAQIQEKLNQLLKKNAEQLEVIDKYVITTKADLNGKILDISTAMANISGYEKEELIGKRHSLFKSGKMSNEAYKVLWETITKGVIWKGELQNITKLQKNYWLDLTILPQYDDENKLIGFLSIGTDITDKKTIEYISEHDKLTQLYNRHKLDTLLELEYERAKRYKHPLSLILIDLDHFKSVNDTYGHLVGDSVLIELATLLKNNIRKNDIIARWGGEEFLIVCIETNLEQATTLAELLREKIEQYSFKNVGTKTASFGVAEFNPEDTITSVLKRCDDLLYEAKDDGRNCVKV